jgi:hypothetical protein
MLYDNAIINQYNFRIPSAAKLRNGNDNKGIVGLEGYLLPADA